MLTSLNCFLFFSYQNYLTGMANIYKNKDSETCVPIHRACAWPPPPPSTTAPKLPLFVLSVGLEGAGHHLWSELLAEPVFAPGCLWINGRHYQRDVGDGVPRLSEVTLAAGLKEQFKIRRDSGMPPCRAIFDGTYATWGERERKRGRERIIVIICVRYITFQTD